MKNLIELLKKNNISEDEAILIFKDSLDKSYNKDIIKELDPIISFWNNKFSSNFRLTTTLSKVYKNIRLTYNQEDIKASINNYIGIAINDEYKKYRLSPYSFFKQNNGFIKFLNM